MNTTTIRTTSTAPIMERPIQGPACPVRIYRPAPSGYIRTMYDDGTIGFRRVRNGVC
jgi:hypothetical protein